MLIFRYDDISAARRMKVEVDEALFHIFRVHRLPLTVGITPKMAEDVHDAECQEFADLGADRRRLDLLERGLDLGWEMALHGLTHRRSAVRDFTEFAMVSRRLQSSRMREGRDKVLTWFPGAPLRVFIPPWNSFDQTTVEVAAAQGFEVLCVGPEAGPETRSGIRIIPSAMTADELISYVRVLSARQLLADLGRSTIVVTFHEFEFRNGDAPDPHRLAALDATVSLLIREGVQFGTASQADPPGCGLSDRADFQSALTMIQKLNGPRGRQLVSRLGLLTGTSREAAGRVFRGFASASRAFEKSKQVARDRVRPVRQSLARTRAVAAGHFGPGPRFSCPFCGFSGTFSVMGDRPNGACPRCRSLERHRFIAATVGPLLKQLSQHRRALMLAPDPLVSILCSSFDEVVTGDIAAPNVDVRFDIQRLPFRQEALDLILAVHVLDEIEDDILALRECRRVLSKGGWLIAPVPIHEEDRTVELDERRGDGKFRLAGRDYFDRIAAEGFVRSHAFDPLEERYADLHERQNIRTPLCIPGTEGVVVFEKQAALERIS